MIHVPRLLRATMRVPFRVWKEPRRGDNAAAVNARQDTDSAEMIARNAGNAVIARSRSLITTKSGTDKFITPDRFARSREKTLFDSMTIQNFQVAIIPGIEILCGRIRADSQPQPLAGKVLDERFRLRIAEHSSASGQRLVVREFFLLGSVKQCFVRHAAPQEVRQPGGKLEVVEGTASVGRLFCDTANEGWSSRREDIDSTVNGLPSSRSIVTLPSAIASYLGDEFASRVSVNVCSSSARRATAAVGSADTTCAATSTAVAES